MQAIFTRALGSWCLLARRSRTSVRKPQPEGTGFRVRHSLAATLYADAIWDEWMRIEEENGSAPRRDVERVS
jgi:hypothetical protein